MTTTGSAQRAAGRDPGRAARRLRGASSGALVMLIIQFVLGTAVNLFVTPAKGGAGEAFSNGPLLALHAVLGLLLVLAAVDLLVRAALARHRTVIVAAALGLTAIAGAAVNGVVFLKTGGNGPSMGMAAAAGVAMLCYAFCLRVLSSSLRAGGRPSPDSASRWAARARAVNSPAAPR